jgi:predicted CopG family antitoxin
MSKEAMRRTTIYVPDDLYRRFHKTCIDEDRPMSDVIRELINRWVRERKAQTTHK